MSDKNIDAEKATITIGLKQLITSALAIIFTLLGLFYTFYSMAVNRMDEKYQEVQESIEKMESNISKTKGDITDVRDMQIKLNTYLEVILKQTIDKKAPAGNTSGGNGATDR